MKPAVVEGFCKKSESCGYVDTGVRKSAFTISNTVKVVYYGLIILSIVLLLKLPENDFWIAMVMFMSLIGAGVIVYMVKWIITPSCPSCYTPPKKIDRVAVTVQQILNKNKQEQETYNYKNSTPESTPTQKSNIHKKRFDPSEEPPGTSTNSSYDYDKCMRGGFDLDFCLETPLFP